MGINIKIENCNNIRKADLNIEKEFVNIKYGMNGTGKSTIAKALKNQGNLNKLQTLGSETLPKLEISEPINNVLVFDTEFVENIVFKGNKAIENAFDVFIKSKDYDEKRSKINKLLNKLNKEIFIDEDMQKLNLQLYKISQKLQLNSSGTKSVKKTATYKSILKKENIFEIPDELEKFTDFIQDEEQNINWVDWKTKGYVYDNKNKCPFCAESLVDEYQTEKEKFVETYTKAGINNLKEILENIDIIKQYLNDDKYNSLITCIRTNKDEKEIELVYKKFIGEVDYLIAKLHAIKEFDSFNIKSSDIGKLDEIVSNLVVGITEITYFGGECFNGIIDKINNKIEEILKDISNLKAEVGEINGFIKNVIKRSKNDINLFLKTAGFNYEFDLDVGNENESSASLIYVGDTTVKVDNIKDHLSWGEKNAFALVLFMYYCLNQNADLIILDDPISSFDSNKKYAIMNRLFANRTDGKSLFKKTVLLLTHDFEPVIDFMKNKKPIQINVDAKYLKNVSGNIIEQEIRKEDIFSRVQLYYNYSKDSINIISRINFLRKYIEHINVSDNSEMNLAYNILSSIVHQDVVPKKQINRDTRIDLNSPELTLGTQYIQNFITDFDYTDIVTNHYTKENLLNLYRSENNNYIKLQIFRVYLEVTGKRESLENDLIKFIDEIYHIENDYMFSLDLLNFDLIPDYIINQTNDFMSRE